MCPCYGFWYRRSAAPTLVLVFGTVVLVFVPSFRNFGTEECQHRPFGNHPFGNLLIVSWQAEGLLENVA